jgi:uridylate kinase
MMVKYKRILLKLSGEALMGQYDFGYDPEVLSQVATEIVAVRESGIEVALVIGGGNLFRGKGLEEAGFDRVRGDQMGMLATVMNALAMQDVIQKLGIPCDVMSALGIEQVGEKYSALVAREKLTQGRIVICAAGSGNPYFTTDTAASLRAIELQADILLKATKVDGIYSADPMKNPDATRYDQLHYDNAIDARLAVMDLTAMVMCRDNAMPLCVFNMFDKGALTGVLAGESVGTLVN